MSLSNLISLFLGVLLLLCVIHIHKQIRNFKQAKLEDKPLWVYMMGLSKLNFNNYIVKLLFRLYYSTLVQVVLLFLRVILCILCIGCYIGFVFVLNSDWGELFK